MKYFKIFGAVAFVLTLFFIGGMRHMSRAQAVATFYVQTADSCRETFPGASYVLTGNGLNVKEGPAPGTKKQTISSAGKCPVQRGNCQVLNACLSWTIPIPVTGTQKYTITETSPPPNGVMCTGGSACNVPSAVHLTIDSTGAIKATVTNTDPDGTIVIWPTGSFYNATITDPALVHNSGLCTTTCLSCDKDKDADDRNFGGVGGHCDNDTDR
jgi:hypothetical protein